MLVGIAAVLAFLLLLAVVQVIRSPLTAIAQLDLVLQPIPGGLELMAPASRALVAEVEARGFELQGVFKPGPRVPPAADAPKAPLRVVSLMADLLSADRRTEAMVYSTSITYERKDARSAIAMDFVSFCSYGPQGEIVKTYNSAADDLLGGHPVNSWRRLPGATVARVAAAHERHVRSRPFAVVPLDAAEIDRRFSLRHCEELWCLEARGLVRLEGNVVKQTRLLKLRTLARALGPGLAEPNARLAVALHVALGALGWFAAPFLLANARGLAPDLVASALFLALATAALALFPRSVIGSSLYVCMPAAVAFALHGARGPVAWLVVGLYSLIGAVARQRLRFRREKARQERLVAAVKAREPAAPPAPPPPGGSSSG